MERLKGISRINLLDQSAPGQNEILDFSFSASRSSQHMRSPADTPIEQRYLWLEGKVSPASMSLIQPGLPSMRPSQTEVVFVGFAYADLPFSKRFDVVFPKDKPEDGVRCSCRIVAATQQFAKPFTEVPHGWSTICAIHFPEGVPHLVQQLPVVDGWGRNSEWVCICDEETWEHLRQAG
jgi:hypothetical protein